MIHEPNIKWENGTKDAPDLETATLFDFILHTQYKRLKTKALHWGSKFQKMRFE